MIADEVEVVFRANTNAYIANVTKAEAIFSAKVDAMQADAERLGVGFSRIGQQARKGFADISRDAPRAATAIRGANVQVGNLAAQFQDIGVQLAGGASPFTIISQQVPQIVAATGSVRGAIGGLGAALTQLISPVGLVSTAFILAASVAASYFSDLLGGEDDSAEALKREADLIQKIADKWGDAAPALKKYADERKKLKDVSELQEATNIAIDEVFEDARKEVDRLDIDLIDLIGTLDLIGEKPEKIRAIQEAFAALKKAVDEGRDSTKENKDLQTALADTFSAESVPAVGKFVDALQSLADKFSTAAQEAKNFRTEAMRALNPDIYGDANQGFYPTINLPDRAPAPERLGPDDFFDGGDQRFTDATSFLKSRAVSDRIADRIDGLDDTLAEALAKLFAQFPNVKIVSAVRTTAEQQAIYDSGVRPAARPGTSRHERGGAVDLRIPPEDIKAFAEAARQVGLENLARIGDPGHYQLAGQRDTGGGVGREPKKTPAQLFEGDIAQVQKRIDLLNAEIEATAGLSKGVEDYGFAVEKAKIKAELLNEAKAKGLAITPELTVRIDQLAGNYAKLSAAKQQNIEADRQLKKSQEDLARSQEEFANFSKDVLGGFINDLVAGKSAAEALAGALEKIGQKLLDIALDQLFAPTAGGGGGFGGFLASIFGGFKAAGGPVSAGKAYIVGEKRPELFVPNSSGKIIPRVPDMAAMRQGGQQTSGFINVSTTNEVINGNLMPTIVQVSGLVGGQQIKQNNKSAAARLQQTQARGTS